MAIINALQHQRVYAESCLELTIYTDYKNLVHFITTKVLNRQQVCQLEMLSQYKFKILYTPRKENSRVDALSQHYNLAGKKIINKFAILRKNNNKLLELLQQLNLIIVVQGEYYVLLQVLEELQEEVISSYYNNLLYRHPSIIRIIELIK